MYDFIDVTEVQSGDKLPSEALKINGEYIENQIQGYRTLYVKGRESLSPELTLYEVGNRNGSILQSKRYPARTIVVGYQLVASSNEAFRAAYNKFADILNIVEAELIFNDEPDKFFIGTPSAIEEVEGGRNSVTGEFEITCADPLKYATEEKEVEAVDGEVIVDYQGTFPAYPTLEANFYVEEDTVDGEESALTGSGDCGFVAFFNDREKIIQLGDPDETEGEDYPKAQTLTNQSFTKSTSWSSAVKGLWPSNVGITSSSVVAQTGTMGLKHSYNSTEEGTYYLTPTNYGSGSDWHGPSVTRTLPNDAAGEAGASNFVLTYKQKMAIGNGKNDSKQLGAFQVLLVNGSGSSRKIVAGVNVFKGSTGKNAKLRFYINGKTADTIDIDLSYNNIYFGNNGTKKIKVGFLTFAFPITTVKTSTITKEDDTITFNIGGIVRGFRDAALKDMKVTQVIFTMTQHGTKPALSYNGLYSVKFVKNNCTTWKDMPNKFSANDVVTADCSTGEILLNDSPVPALGALGNDWEEFYLQKGVNQIGVSYSDWTTNPPSCKLRYREAYL